MVPSITSQATQAALLDWADSMLVQLLPDRDPDIKAKKPEHFFDGTVFSALLEILDTEYNPSRFQQSLAASKADGDISQGRRRNLHIIHMGLKDFARRHCSKIEPLINQVDFQAQAKEPTKTGTFEVTIPTSSSSESRIATKIYHQILVLFVAVACFREDDNSKYITLVTNLETKYQQGIFQILKEVDAKLGQVAEATDSDPDGGHAPADLDDELAQEAALVQLQYEADEAKRQAGGLKLRLDRLQDNYDELLRKHEELQEENEHLHKQIESEVGNFDKHRLQRQLKENESLIANLENERNYLVDERERLVKEKGRLELVARKAEALTDENQELRSKNEDLSKKANMADNLRKKLESLKAVEADFKTLQNERVDASKLMEQLDGATMRIETLKRETEAYATKMQGYEIDIANFNNQKTMYTAENAELRLRLEDLQARSQIDEGVVRELQEKVMMLDPSATPSTPLGPRPTTLEDELSESNNAISMRNLELQRLQAENAVLKSSIGTETEKGQLIQEMEDLRASRQVVQDKFNDMLEKYTVGQHQLDALIQNMGKDGLVQAIQACYDVAPGTKWLMSNYFREEAYSNLRTQVLAEQNIAKQLERQLAAAKEQLADRDRALLEARGDCKMILREYLMDHDADDVEQVNAVEKSSLDALAELKRTDGMLAVSLRAELETERKKHKALKDEFETQKSQLLTAFIEKDQLRREAEAANREMQRAADGLTVNTDSARQSEKMEKLRTRYKQLQQVSPTFSLASIPSDDTGVIRVDVKRQSLWDVVSPWFGKKKERPESSFQLSQEEKRSSFGLSGRPQYEQSELKNRELERTLKAVRAGSEAGAQKAQTDQIIKNLQRENAMITTAWYDLTSRLQSNHVVLQRRNDVPKSWLNKQRQMVNATPRK
ncbi:uncharacterized protein F4822DRAFT_440809 [Hypoxylon trugodes]|uniref:uncharacterized protein n=1 Tax=Hypoxylon trugodes TaxID=326681 RepID=UPI00219C85EE|nr:uncharacterized protein F4822DRAFT_440809 [Hypoxylon trugodes]KAI1382737.1 hypothetical protein F4822DRAFT_440809 [Hypoxylon trugodes]